MYRYPKYALNHVKITQFLPYHDKDRENALQVAKAVRAGAVLHARFDGDGGPRLGRFLVVDNVEPLDYLNRLLVRPLGVVDTPTGTWRLQDHLDLKFDGTWVPRPTSAIGMFPPFSDECVAVNHAAFLELTLRTPAERDYLSAVKDLPLVDLTPPPVPEELRVRGRATQALIDGPLREALYVVVKPIDIENASDMLYGAEMGSGTENSCMFSREFDPIESLKELKESIDAALAELNLTDFDPQPEGPDA